MALFWTGKQRYWDAAVNYYHLFSPTFLTELVLVWITTETWPTTPTAVKRLRREIGVDIPGANSGPPTPVECPASTFPTFAQLRFRRWPHQQAP